MCSSLTDHLTVAALCLISLVRAATLNPGRVPLIDDTKLSGMYLFFQSICTLELVELIAECLI